MSTIRIGYGPIFNRLERPYQTNMASAMNRAYRMNRDGAPYTDFQFISRKKPTTLDKILAQFYILR